MLIFGHRKKKSVTLFTADYTAHLQLGWNPQPCLGPVKLFLGEVGDSGGAAVRVWSCVDGADSGMGHCRMWFSHSLLGRSQVEGKHLAPLTFTWMEKQSEWGKTWVIRNLWLWMWRNEGRQAGRQEGKQRSTWRRCHNSPPYIPLLSFTRRHFHLLNLCSQCEGLAYRPGALLPGYEGDCVAPRPIDFLHH